MKKTLILATILGALVSAPAIAKTEGNQVGVSLIRTDISQTTFKSSNTNNVGVGVDYKYAFNFDKVFLAPGLFYDYNHADSSTYNASGANAGTAQNKLKQSYGVKADLGYDINDRLAAFVTVGLSNNVMSTGAGFSNANNSASKTYGGVLYGVGAKYALNDMFDINLALERTNYDAGRDGGRTVNNSYDVIRLGTAVKF